MATGAGQVVDEVAFAGSTRGRDLLDSQALGVLSLVSEGTLVAGAVLVVVLAVLRRRLPLAVAAVAVIGGANVSTQLLKHVVLPRPDLGLGDLNSLPSGHTTAAGTLAVALVLVVPAAARSAAAVLGATYTAATGVSTLVAGWHRPSDVLAAVLVVGAWSALAVAGLRLHGASRARGSAARPADPSRPRPGAAPVLVGAGAAVLLLGALALLVAALAIDASGTVVVWSAAQDAGRTVQLLSYGGGALVSAAGSSLLLGVVQTLLRRTPT